MKKTYFSKVLVIVLTLVIALCALPISVISQELAAIVALSGGDIVESGYCGADVIWKLDTDGVLTINGRGKMKDYSYPATPWYERKASIRSVVVENGVTAVGSGAFKDCVNLSSISLPESVKRIGDFAFSGCSSLTAVNIPESVTKIGEWAFLYCSKLESVIIPSGVATISNHTFDGCTSLRSIVIPESVKIISYAAFRGCTSLGSLTIPSGVTSIGDLAFFNCTSLAAVNIPEEVTEVGRYTFAGCSALTFITIPKNVSKICDHAFKNCRNLAAVNVDTANLYYSSQDGVLFNKSLDKLVIYPDGKAGDYTVPSTVTAIGKYAFDDCVGLESVMIPESVDSIGDYAFYSCTSLSNITISQGVSRIGNCSFNECIGLNTVSVPANVSSLGDHAFRGCSELSYVEFKGNAPAVGINTFDDCDTNFTVFYVPGTSGWTDSDAYDPANGTWNTYRLVEWSKGSYDLNGDMVVDDKDLEIIFGHIMGTDPLAGDSLAAADIYGSDGVVDIRDYNFLFDVIGH